MESSLAFVANVYWIWLHSITALLCLPEIVSCHSIWCSNVYWLHNCSISLAFVSLCYLSMLG